MQDLFLNRRRMLKVAAGVVTGLSLGTACKSPLRRGQAAEGFKIGVCDWTVGKRSNPGSFEVAKRIGLDGVQVDFGGGDILKFL